MITKDEKAFYLCQSLPRFTEISGKFGQVDASILIIIRNPL